MDGHFKKFASEAGQFFTRAKQFTEEKLGQAERTEYDPQFSSLLEQCDRTRMFTEGVLRHTEALLQPHPGSRLEDYVYDKVGQRRRDKLTYTEELGQSLLDAGNDFGSNTPYGNALMKVGSSQQKLGQTEREFVRAAANNFIQPLQAFLDGDMKTVQKERKILEEKRLDLDSAKSRLRKVKSTPGSEKSVQSYGHAYATLCSPWAIVPEDSDDESPRQPHSSSNSQAAIQQDHSVDDLLEDPGLPTVKNLGEAIAQAEAEIRVSQADFDRQLEMTKLLLEGISSTHAHHLRCLHDFVEAQQAYYAQCSQHMNDLQKQLGR